MLLLLVVVVVVCVWWWWWWWYHGRLDEVSSGGKDPAHAGLPSYAAGGESTIGLPEKPDWIRKPKSLYNLLAVMGSRGAPWLKRSVVDHGFGLLFILSGEDDVVVTCGVSARLPQPFLHTTAPDLVCVGRGW